MAKKYLKNEKGIVRAVTSDNLQLEKPLLNENYDIEVHNRNMDKIDVAIQEVKRKVDGLELIAEKVSIADASNVFASTNVEGALNELFQNANNGKSTIATSVGSPLLATDTFSAMGTKINTIKSTLASNLTKKAISASSGETLTSLANKVGNISTRQKIAAGDSVTILGSTNSVYVGSDLSSGYGKYICSCRILAEGSMRIKLSFNWEVSSGNGATCNIVATRNGSDVLISATGLNGTNGETVEYSIDVNVQYGDFVTVYIKQPYGKYPTAYPEGFFCNYV